MPVFKKQDAGKPMANLLPPRALMSVARVLTHGAVKYGPENWRGVDDTTRYEAAALRHVLAHLDGEVRDPDTGEMHLAHAACSLLFLVDLAEGGRCK